MLRTAEINAITARPVYSPTTWTGVTKRADVQTFIGEILFLSSVLVCLLLVSMIIPLNLGQSSTLQDYQVNYAANNW